MKKRLRPKLSYANVTASIALFFALCGGAYAATALPNNSVGTPQLKKGAVTAAKGVSEAKTASRAKPAPPDRRGRSAARSPAAPR